MSCMTTNVIFGSITKGMQIWFLCLAIHLWARCARTPLMRESQSGNPFLDRVFLPTNKAKQGWARAFCVEIWIRGMRKFPPPTWVFQVGSEAWDWVSVFTNTKIFLCIWCFLIILLIYHMNRSITISLLKLQFKRKNLVLNLRLIPNQTAIHSYKKNFLKTTILPVDLFIGYDWCVAQTFS